MEFGIIEQNPVRGVRKAKDRVNARRLSEQEYRTLGDILRKAVEDGQYETTAEIIQGIAQVGCRRSGVIGLRRGEVSVVALWIFQPSVCRRGREHPRPASYYD